jgi:hypothetical protein
VATSPTPSLVRSRKRGDGSEMALIGGTQLIDLLGHNGIGQDAVQ